MRLRGRCWYSRALPAYEKPPASPGDIYFCPICNILYKHAHSKEKPDLTATDLCKMTNMLKSQMNRTLNQLEEKNLISRERSTTDKRQVYVTMNLQQCHIYETQHKQILSILDAVISKLGYERSRDAIRILNAISEVAEQLNLGK